MKPLSDIYVARYLRGEPGTRLARDAGISTFTFYKHLHGLGVEVRKPGVSRLAFTDAALARLVGLVSAEFDIPEQDIVGRSRVTDVAHARHVVCWLAYDILGESYPAIAERLGRDHTTIMHSVCVIRDKRDENPGYRRRLDILAKRVS